jgi:hypothetical protein
MARGISENFLRVARREQRLATRSALLAAALAFPAAFLAELADEPGYGPIWGLFLMACVAGLALGMVLARRRVEHYEADLRVQWNHWMRAATNAARISDIDRRSHDKDPLPQALPGGLALGLLALNLLLFALLWVGHPLALTLAMLVILADGLLLGAMAAASALLGRWAREFVRTAEDMVQKGEVAMWGER